MALNYYSAEWTYNCLKPFFVCFFHFESSHDWHSLSHPAGFIWRCWFTSIRWLRKWCFGFCVIVECRNAKFNGTDATRYRNASIKFTSLPNITPKPLPIFFHNWNCFPNLFRFLNSMSKLTFSNCSEKSTFPLIRRSFTKDKYISSPILLAVIELSTTFFSILEVMKYFL